jgi:VWFA-related protein
MQYSSSVAILTALSVCPLFAESAATPLFRTDVNMVMLTFKVENRGRPVPGLGAADVEVLEDGVAQQITDFVASRSSEAENQPRVPESIFLLVDTSNAMYRGYAYAYDAIAQFIRGLDPRDAIAVYTFSRNVSRSAPLTLDRYKALEALQQASAGDDTALYNSMLIALRDAEKVPGPRKLVVFSNGADNASLVSPDDVARVAEDAGIPIYVVSTQANDEISVNVWARITKRTGGEAHYAPLWSMQGSAFRAISEAIRGAYTVTYYSNSAKPGFRRLAVRVKGRHYSIHCRPGYSAPPKPETHTANAQAADVCGPAR